MVLNLKRSAFIERDIYIEKIYWKRYLHFPWYVERTSEEGRVWSVSTKSVLVTSLPFAIGDYPCLQRVACIGAFW